MRIRCDRHAAQPWRLAEIAPDFELIDAWALPLSAHPSEFGALEEIFSKLDPERGAGHLTGALFALRWRLGRWFGWDANANSLPIPGCQEHSLRERLPLDLRDSGAGAPESGRFRVLYRTPTEWARELSNGTVHAVMHVGWVPKRDGSYGAQLGVYVKPRGRFGRLYMAAIRPFRHFIVYPALMRMIGREWRHRGA
jgi:hypothetical protein